jgi:hypothetical protein
MGWGREKSQSLNKKDGRKIPPSFLFAGAKNLSPSMHDGGTIWANDYSPVHNIGI